MKRQFMMSVPNSRVGYLLRNVGIPYDTSFVRSTALPYPLCIRFTIHF